MKELFYEKSKTVQFGIRILNNVDNTEVTEIDFQSEGLYLKWLSILDSKI